MIDVKLIDQTWTFLCSFLSGVLLGLVYILFKCFRASFNNRRIPTVVFDVMFMLIFTIITCLFSIGFTDGFVRYYVVIGEIVGLLAFKFTLGYVFYKLFEHILKYLRKIKEIIIKNISVILKKLLKAGHKMLYNKVNKKAKSAN